MLLSFTRVQQCRARARVGQRAPLGVIIIVKYFHGVWTYCSDEAVVVRHHPRPIYRSLHCSEVVERAGRRWKRLQFALDCRSLFVGVSLEGHHSRVVNFVSTCFSTAVLNSSLQNR